MLVSSRFVWGCCRPCFKTKTVGAYRIRPSWRGKCTSNDGVMLGDIMWNHPVQASYYPWNDRIGVGAYRIRPDVGENETMATNMSPSTNVLFRRREGVCDTPLHLFGHFTDDMMTEPDDLTCWWRTHHPRRTSNHAAMKGVCDTPLHLFDHFTGDMITERCVFTPTLLPYSRAPYHFSVISWVTPCSNERFWCCS